MATVQRSNMTRKDAKGKVLRAPKESADTAANYQWWTCKKENEMADSIGATLKKIQQGQSGRIAQLTMSSRLYGASDTYNLMGSAFVRNSSAAPTTQRLSYNLCSSIGETLEAKMAKNNVIPTYITNGAIWKNQKKAMQLTKFTQGLFYQHKMHMKTIESFSDAECWGDGFIHTFRNHEDKVDYEKDLPHEIWVDTVESTVGEPRQLHRVKIRDRDWARVRYPDLQDQIDTCEPIGYDDLGAAQTVADLIVVVESWRLPSSKDAGDGVYAITIGKKSVTEEYKRMYFPLAHLRYVKRKIGWYGQGIPERVQNIQGEINRSMILKQRSLWMMGSFKVLVENGSKVVSQHLNNEVGTIVNYVGKEPTYVTPPATNPELDRWTDSLIQKGFDQEGVSRLSTTGEAPIGVESGKALRTLTQIGDDRFLFTGQNLEEFNLEISKQSIDVVKEIYEETGTYEVIYPQTNFTETIDWKDIDLEDDAFWLKAFPTSSLSDDLTGRLSEIQEMMQAGLISPRVGKRLMDMPDVEMADSLANASYDLLCSRIEDMIFDGKDFQPEQFNDLTLAKDLALKYYNYAQLHNCPEKRLGLLRNFLAQINDLTTTAAAGVPQPVPTANPTPTPTSDLIPNAAQGAA